MNGQAAANGRPAVGPRSQTKSDQGKHFLLKSKRKWKHCGIRVQNEKLSTLKKTFSHFSLGFFCDLNKENI